MLTAILLVIYAADVLDSVRLVLLVAGVTAGLGWTAATLVRYTESFGKVEPLPILRRVGIAALLAIAAAVLLPTRMVTSIGIAGYAAQLASETEEYRLIRQLVLKRLRSLVEESKS